MQLVVGEVGFLLGGLDFIATASGAVEILAAAGVLAGMSLEPGVNFLVEAGVQMGEVKVTSKGEGEVADQVGRSITLILHEV